MNHDDDDEPITKALTDRARSPEDELALARVHHFVSQHAFAAPRRQRFALELLVAGVVAAVVVTVIVGITRPTLPAPSPSQHTPVASASAGVPTPSPSPSLGPTIPMRITQQLNLGPRVANAMAVSPGTVWVATQGEVYGDSGRLIRINATTDRQTASWVIGGDPDAISAAGGYVWVANSFGDGSRVLPYQNTVMQFNAATGSLVHLYRVDNPGGVVANGSSAVVVSGGYGPTVILRLSGGRSSTIATVPGMLSGPSVSPQSALAVCANQLYLAMSNASPAGSSVTIYGLRSTGGAVRRIATLPNHFMAVMTCDSTSLYLSAGDNGAILRLNSSNGSVEATWPGTYPEALSFAAGRLWELDQSGTATPAPDYLTALDPVTGLASSSRLSLPGTSSYGAFLLVLDASGLWVVGGSTGNVVLHIAIG